MAAEPHPSLHDIVFYKTHIGLRLEKIIQEFKALVLLPTDSGFRPSAPPRIHQASLLSTGPGIPLSTAMCGLNRPSNKRRKKTLGFRMTLDPLPSQGWFLSR